MTDLDAKAIAIFGGVIFFLLLAAGIYDIMDSAEKKKKGPPLTDLRSNKR